MAGLSKIKTGGLHTGCVSADAIATGAITVADIPDGEISHVKLAADCVDGDNIADDVVLGGNPTTTTQSASNNSTRIATTAYVDTAVGNLSQDSMTEGNTKAEVVDTGSDGHFKVETEGSERLRVIADGKVGIGTTTPSCELEIAGTGCIELPQGTTAQRPTGAAGKIRFNTTSGQMEYWSSTSTTPQWRDVDEEPLIVVNTHFLVLAGGGGGGGGIMGGGGGAGGYRTSWGSGNISGGNSAVESALQLQENTAYTVTVGAGGAGGANGNNSSSFSNMGVRGSDSVFATVTSNGGGPGVGYYGNTTGTPHSPLPTTNTGFGSGGGHGAQYPPDGAFLAAMQGTAGQGHAGGIQVLTTHSGDYNGMGGGGAGGAGENRVNASDQPGGGDGLASTITGSSVIRGGGGGGGAHGGSNNGGSGGSGGGGNGAAGNGAAGPGMTAGTANTGGGGGGAGGTSGQAGAAGGSGLVVIRIPNTHTATFSGVTASAASAVGSDRVYTVTAGTGTVTFTLD
jgi:hypothetical protein